MSLDWDGWARNLTKRVIKVSDVRDSDWHWEVEAKKRLLQTATVACAMIEAIESGNLKPNPIVKEIVKEIVK